METKVAPPLEEETKKKKQDNEEKEGDEKKKEETPTRINLPSNEGVVEKRDNKKKEEEEEKEKECKTNHTFQVVKVTFGDMKIDTDYFVKRVATFIGTQSMYVSTEVDIVARVGDPQPGVAKNLIVEYAWNGVSLQRHVPEYGHKLREPLVVGDVDQVVAVFPELKLAPQLDVRVCTMFEDKYSRTTKKGNIKIGLEVGGPSFHTFGADLYPLCPHLDNLVFSQDTVWHQTTTGYQVLQRVVGVQHIGEASDTKLPTHSYDYVLGSHCLEHTANALQTLKEWERLVKPGGWIVVVLPWKHATFDHRRPYTTLQHLREDLVNRVDERDTTHIEDILKHHDFQRDPPARDVEFMRQRSEKNIQNRCLHHHVFSQSLLFEIAEELGYRVIEMVALREYDLVCIYQTPDVKV